MSPKLLTILAALAVLLGVLALALVGRDARHAGEPELGLLHPGLEARLNDAVEVEVTTAEGGYHLRLRDGRWVLAEKGGYPVKVADIRRALWGLAALEKRQPMTEDPARYDRLGVEDRPAPGSGSKRITLRDAQGKDLAALIVGQTRAGRGAAASFYARIPSERRAWLVEGELTLPADLLAWMDRQPVKLERRNVKAVRTRHPDGETVVVARPSREQETFEVAGVPEGRELRFATVASGMGSALEYLSFEDVAPAADFEQSGAAPVETSLWTFDGLRVDARIWSKGDDEHWVAFSAAYDPAGAPSAAAPVLDEETGEFGPPPPPAEEPPTPERVAEVERRASELAERLTGWVYRIAPYNKGNLAKRMEDLTQAIRPPDSLAAPEWGQDIDPDFDDPHSHGDHLHGDEDPLPVPDEPPPDDDSRH